MMNSKDQQPTKAYETIKLGIDAHARFYYVCRQVDGATPQAVQKMGHEGLLRFVARQLRSCRIGRIIPLNSVIRGGFLRCWIGLEATI